MSIRNLSEKLKSQDNALAEAHDKLSKALQAQDHATAAATDGQIGFAAKFQRALPRETIRQPTATLAHQDVLSTATAT